MSDVPAGWNPDPSNPNQERWWDGQQWSPHQVRPKQPTDAPPNQFPQQPSSSAQFPNAAPTAQQHGQPQPSFQGQPFGGAPKQSSNATLLVIVGGSIALFLVVALVGIVLFNRSGDDNVEASRSATTQQTVTGSPIEPELPPVGEPPLPPPANQAPTDGLEDVSNCVLQGEEALSLDITNSTGTVNDYVVELAYLDAAGSRVDDGSYYVRALRPGEVAQEQQRRIDPEISVASCEILEVSRRAVEFDQALVDQVSECEMSFEKYSTKSKMTVTNPDAETYDYSIVIALTGPDGVRRSTSEGYVDNVRSNEPTAADASLYRLEDEEYLGLSCEVVHVTRRDK